MVTAIIPTDESIICEYTTGINSSRKSMQKGAGSIPASPRAIFSIQEKTWQLTGRPVPGSRRHAPGEKTTKERQEQLNRGSPRVQTSYSRGTTA